MRTNASQEGSGLIDRLLSAHGPAAAAAMREARCGRDRDRGQIKSHDGDDKTVMMMMTMTIMTTTTMMMLMLRIFASAYTDCSDGGVITVMPTSVAVRATRPGPARPGPARLFPALRCRCCMAGPEPARRLSAGPGTGPGTGKDGPI